MAKLNLPPATLKIIEKDDEVTRVYDRLRRKPVALTPEEWVRQHFVDYLINHLGYPEGLLANEVNLTLNSTQRRCDTVLFAPAGYARYLIGAAELGNLRPVMIIEYKGPRVKITQQVFDQAARYNLVMGAPFIVVSNGMVHYCCVADGDSYRFLPAIPTYRELLNIITPSSSSMRADENIKK